MLPFETAADRQRRDCRGRPRRLSYTTGPVLDFHTFIRSLSSPVPSRPPSWGSGWPARRVSRLGEERGETVPGVAGCIGVEAVATIAQESVTGAAVAHELVVDTRSLQGVAIRWRSCAQMSGSSSPRSMSTRPVIVGVNASVGSG